MPVIPNDILDIASVSPDDIKIAFPSFGRIGTMAFIKKTRKAFLYLEKHHSDSKVVSLLARVKLSEEMQERIPFLTAGYLIHGGENGKCIPKPFRVIVIFKETFTGCLKLSNGNQFASFMMALLSTGLSLWPSFEHQNQFIIIAQMLIKLAHSSVVYDITDVEDALKDISELAGDTYGLF